MKIPLETKLTISASYGLALGCGMDIVNIFPEASEFGAMVAVSIFLWIVFEIADEIYERKNAFVTRTLWNEDGRKIVLTVPNMDGKSEFASAAFLLNQVKGQI